MEVQGVKQMSDRTLLIIVQSICLFGVLLGIGLAFFGPDIWGASLVLICPTLLGFLLFNYEYRHYDR